MAIRVVRLGSSRARGEGLRLGTAPAAARLLTLLAALSRETNFSIGCCCKDESRCHRSVLKELLLVHGVKVV
jgi:hypothetical protein